MQKSPGEYLSKGSSVYLEGKPRTRKFEDKQGQIRFITENWVQSLQILDRREESPHNRQPIKESYLKEFFFEPDKLLPPINEDISF
ncbi:MAG: single-stranded DNA-binding protein [Caldimicrobium sp.]